MIDQRQLARDEHSAVAVELVPTSETGPGRAGGRTGTAEPPAHGFWFFGERRRLTTRKLLRRPNDLRTPTEAGPRDVFGLHNVTQINGKLVRDFGRAEKNKNKRSGLGNSAPWSDGHEALLYLLSRRPSGPSTWRNHDTTMQVQKASGQMHPVRFSTYYQSNSSDFRIRRTWWSQRYHSYFRRTFLQAKPQNQRSEYANKPQIGDPATSTKTDRSYSSVESILLFPNL